MPSKMVTDRQKTALALLAETQREAEAIAGAAGEKLASTRGEGATSVDVQNLLLLMGRHVVHLADRMVRVDESNFDGARGDGSLRRRRDEVAAELGSRLVTVRRAVDATFGAKASLEALGLEGRIGRDPVVLHRKAERAIRRLADGSLAELEPRIQGVILDPVALVAQLAPATDRADGNE